MINRGIHELICQEYDLPCYDGRKSFYGKARVIVSIDGVYLQSYDTLICFFGFNGTFKKLWTGYTPTTWRHIKSFLRHMGIIRFSTKKTWDEIPFNETIVI